jgi:outer membrane protein OmpA-like peptidoglycan-associated protein
MTFALPFLVRRSSAVLATAVFLASPAVADSGVFDPGWTLDPQASALRFQSVKNGATVEVSEFATVSGAILSDGKAEVRIALDSVDTGIDLRNVRMRFLFFETFLFPEAVVSLYIDPTMVEGLSERRRMTVSLPFTLSLHGVTRELVAPVSVTLIAEDLVAVASDGPVIIAAADFGLAEGVTKLQEAANVTIVPSGSVTFDFLFARNGGALAPAAASEDAEDTDLSAALEPEGFLDLEACSGRFEILSAAGNITFRSGSAILDDSSTPLLSTLLDIVTRCPGMKIEIGGHTDSDGSDEDNLLLSDRRARAVADWLTGQGADPSRFTTRGYGETQPLVPNDSSENRARNRRIGFLVVGL